MNIKQVVVFIFFIVWGCSDPQTKYQSSFSNALFEDLESNDKLDSLMNLSVEGALAINLKWQVVTADTMGGLIPDLPLFDQADSIVLPHRILLANSPIWYRTVVRLDTGILHINADDGAQLWIDDRRIPRLKGEIFPFEPDSVKETQITIRVLNNAMHGGLRSVRWIAQSDWSRHQLNKIKNFEQWKNKRKTECASSDEITTQLDLYPAMLTDPFWQSANDSLYLRWVSERGGQAIIHWGNDSLALNRRQVVSSASGDFIMAFSSTGENIYYQISHESSLSKIYSFQKPSIKEAFNFVLWGDSQGGWSTFRQLLTLMNEHQPAFGIGAGDLVNEGSDRIAYLQLLQSLSQSSFVHYPVPGNHDYDGYYDDLYPKNYFELLALPKEKQYFSWQEGNCAFIALDPDERFPIGIPEGSVQYNWFIEQIQSIEWKSAEWRFVVLHHPPFAQGWPDYHGEESILKLLEPYFESAKIDMVVAGHSHDYERLIKLYGKQTTAFLVVGGGGGGIEPDGLSEWPKMDTVIKTHHYGLVSIDDQSLTFKAFDKENILIDSLQLTHL